MADVNTAESPAMDGLPQGEDEAHTRSNSSVDKSSRKRPLSKDQSVVAAFDVAMEGDVADGFTDFEEPPSGIHPVMWEMLKAIKRDTANTREDVKCIDDRLLILEDQHDHTGNDIANLKANLSEVTEGFKTLAGRLIRAETIIERQHRQITDLTTRSMRDNLIIRSTGAEYKEKNQENTASIFKTFIAKELHVANSDKVVISRAHRMGQASSDYNKMMIAKIPSSEDQSKILSNASALRNTGHSISKQLPPEIDERKQFAWQEYKQARSANRPARFDNGRLFIAGEPIIKYDPISLPTVSSSLMGLPNPDIAMGRSESIESHGHLLRAWAIPIDNLQDVREGMDALLRSEDLAKAHFAPYAFRYRCPEGQIRENFNSDQDRGLGLSILKTLRSKESMNVAVYISHIELKPSTPLRGKVQCVKDVVSGALLALNSQSL